MKISDQDLVAHIEKLIESNKNSIPENIYIASINYINHSEYELAFEAVFIGIMRSKKYYLPESRSLYMAIAKLLQLDKSSILDGSFWEKFHPFIESEQ